MTTCPTCHAPTPTRALAFLHEHVHEKSDRRPLTISDPLPDLLFPKCGLSQEDTLKLAEQIVELMADPPLTSDERAEQHGPSSSSVHEYGRAGKCRCGTCLELQIAELKVRLEQRTASLNACEQSRAEWERRALVAEARIAELQELLNVATLIGGGE